MLGQPRLRRCLVLTQDLLVDLPAYSGKKLSHADVPSGGLLSRPSQQTPQDH